MQTTSNTFKKEDPANVGFSLVRRVKKMYIEHPAA
jgi:hypothetical protein